MSLRCLDMAQSQRDMLRPSSSRFPDAQGEQATEPPSQYKDPPNTPIPRHVESVTPDAGQLEQLLARLSSRVHPFDPSCPLRSTPKATPDEYDRLINAEIRYLAKAW
ncbi:hypothetical protein N7519_011098 [Penicillium mononematosum]|uniref:uncharacterized protein n=1 Tax=Penicillium mononematosum TaxID=268346 RepID=UPI0025476088|nr:uncharacterized protein N7519_011098 [Penicillium mononematosum]KAJ6180637.1 hypothetical protein N7519_011098 [Penicillium mononematosum]